MLKKRKYIKACPFLRDLGDSYLCVCGDDVVEVELDPLLNIQWSEEVPPVASQIPGKETCLFVLEIQEDGRLFCISRQIYLSMDERTIYWDDIRDSVLLMNLNDPEVTNEDEFEFCSTCLYKVLLASSPAFQTKLDKKERLRLGHSYLLYKANQIINSLNQMNFDDQTSTSTIDFFEKIDAIDPSKTAQSTNSIIDFLTLLIQQIDTTGELTSLFIQWVQKFDEWRYNTSIISEEKTESEKIERIRQVLNLSRRLNEIAFDILMKTQFQDFHGEETEPEKEQELAKMIQKIFLMNNVQLEDFAFITTQVLKIFDDD
ncbi:MAG: hypothetical protein GF308_05165 [Candidatus Heimdallarchaeota archaeon]|nr:hypothetical protein [Candidatus Heimdallarchaeota archaeon]